LVRNSPYVDRWFIGRFGDSFYGDPAKSHLIVKNNIRFNKGKLTPKNNPSMILFVPCCVGASEASLGPEAPWYKLLINWPLAWKSISLKGEELRSLSIAGMLRVLRPLLALHWGQFIFIGNTASNKHAGNTIRLLFCLG